MKKYIIIGLGSFGASLAEKLTQEGNEVIGVDASMAKVDAMKDKLSHVIRLDATDQITVSGLPIAQTDVVIVAIGEDQGANIMATAIMKNLKAKRLISRAISRLHEGVLQAIGVDEIVHPEEETAERWAKKLCLKGLVDSFELAGEVPWHEPRRHRVPKELQCRCPHHDPQRRAAEYAGRHATGPPGAGSGVVQDGPAGRRGDGHLWAEQGHKKTA